MHARSTLALALAAASLAAGCGGDDDPSSGGAAARTAGAPDPVRTEARSPAQQRAVRGNQRRDGALACIRGRGIDARGIGADRIQIGDPPDGARVQFYNNSGVAEGFQFEGEGEGAEQIGAALFWTGNADEKQLDVLEACLMDQA
jgi:hypothetical protein